MFGHTAADIVADTSDNKTLGSFSVQYNAIENTQQLESLATNLKDQVVISIDALTDDAPNFDFSLRALSICYS